MTSGGITASAGISRSFVFVQPAFDEFFELLTRTAVRIPEAGFRAVELRVFSPPELDPHVPSAHR